MDQLCPPERPKPKVLVTLPNEGWAHLGVLLWCMKHLLTDQRFVIQFEAPRFKPFENALHHIAKGFWESDFDVWMTLDTDNAPECNPLDLVELLIREQDPLSIVGCPTPIWKWTGVPNHPLVVNNTYKRRHPGSADYVPWPVEEGLQEVDSVGTGCLLMHRRVFEHPDMQKGAFLRVVAEDGRVLKGPDVAFCERAKAAGFPVHAHFDFPCRHDHTVNLATLLAQQKAGTLGCEAGVPAPIIQGNQPPDRS